MDSSIHQAPGLQFGEYVRFFHVKKRGKNRFAKGTIVRFISGLWWRCPIFRPQINQNGVISENMKWGLDSKKGSKARQFSINLVVMNISIAIPTILTWTTGPPVSVVGDVSCLSHLLHHVCVYIYTYTSSWMTSQQISTVYEGCSGGQWWTDPSPYLRIWFLTCRSWPRTSWKVPCGIALYRSEYELNFRFYKYRHLVDL